MLDRTATAFALDAPRSTAAAGMNEPGIFKGCSEVDGPLTTATKNAILAYLGKPNAASWDRLRQRPIAGTTTLGDAWAMASPGGAKRFPTSAELIRSIRVAVVARWAANSRTLRTH